MSEIPPPPPPAPAAPYSGAAVPGSKNWMGIVGLILSILAILLACCWGSGILFAAGGAVLGFLGKKAADNGEATNRGLSSAAFILGIVAAALSAIVIVLGIFGFAAADWSSYY